MTLQQKTLTITTLTLVALFSLLYSITRGILNTSFSRLERQETTRNVERAVNGYRLELARLNDVCREWGVWDDAYDYVQTANPKFAEANLTESNFEQIRLNLLLFLRSDGQVMFAKSFDPATKALSDVPRSFMDQLQASPAVRQHAEPSSSVTGLMLLPEGPLMFASRPVLPSVGTGQIRGTVVMGRYLDRLALESLGEATRLALSARRLDDPAPPGDFASARAEAESGRIAVVALGEDQIAGYGLVRDLSNRSGLLLRVNSSRETYRQGKTALLYLGLSLLAAGLVIGALNVLIMRRVTRPLERVVERLSASAAHLVTAAENVSSASQAYADGAARQAGSIETTSESLDRLAGLTQSNASHAAESDELMKRAATEIASAERATCQLTVSMQEIQSAIGQTRKIVHSIDVIAFQTNLLALNAAVEAARAGEAGAGFAVVADEVRRLAGHSAEAAKSTAQMIETTESKVKSGAAAAAEVQAIFSGLAETQNETAELAGEIAAASREQVSDFQDVNRSVTEVDKVTQENAARAGESAEASRQMHAEADQMTAIVEELREVLGTART